MDKSEGLMSAPSHQDMHQKVSQANVDYYNKCAKQYEVIEETIFARENEERVHGIIKELGGKYEKGSLLDVGCGTGNILRFALQHFKEVTGTDISAEMLERSRQYTDRLVQADASQLPFDHDSFHVVTAYSVLHHLYDPFPVIQEMYRVCKKGGVVFTDNDPNGYFQKRFKWYKNLRKKLYKKKYDQSLPDEGSAFQEDMKLAEYHHYYADGLDAQRIKNMFEKAGFTEVNVMFRFHPRPNLFTKVIKVLLFFEPKEKKCPFLMVMATK